MNTSPFRCDMSAFSKSERNHHIKIIQDVFGSVQKVDELPDGYSFYLTEHRKMIHQTATFIVGERLCCPFFNFELYVKPDKGVWLNIKGPEGIKPFIVAEIGRALDHTVAQQTGFIE